jgi:hypothetical protein
MRLSMSDQALMIVRAIYEDARDRGLFDGIDDEVMGELVQSWFDAVLGEITNPKHAAFPPGMTLLEKVRA